jgi:tryptophan-rich hypothetical protein
MPTLKKLDGSKWTAVAPVDREKHFVVTRVIEDRGDRPRSVSVEIRSVLTGRRRIVALEVLRDPEAWRPGWA